MAASANWYARAFENMLGGSGAAEARQTDYLSDDVKIRLHTNAYTPDLDAHEVVGDLTNEVAAGGGYTAGGVALGTKTIAYTAAGSAPAWQGTHAYVVGDIVRKVASNGHVYRCIVAGTSGAGEPTWPTVSGQTVTDGATLVWAEIGRGYVTIDAADASWAAATITARYGIIYNNTPADKPLLWLLDFGADIVSTGGTFLVQFDPGGIAVLSSP